MVSMLSIGFGGSKKTRLLKQGRAGKLVEFVDDSWMAKPCGRSSRSITLSVPPVFGVCAVARQGGGDDQGDGEGGWRMRGRRKRVIVFPFLCGKRQPFRGRPNVHACGGKTSEGPEKVPRMRGNYTAKARAPTTRGHRARSSRAA